MFLLLTNMFAGPSTICRWTGRDTAARKSLLDSTCSSESLEHAL